MEFRFIPTDKIYNWDGFWYRMVEEPDKERQLEEEWTSWSFPPVRVLEEPDRFILFDGIRRLKFARSRQFKIIPAYLYKKDTLLNQDMLLTTLHLNRNTLKTPDIYRCLSELAGRYTNAELLEQLREGNGLLSASYFYPSEFMTALRKWIDAREAADFTV